MPDGEQILEDAPDVREPSDETSTGGVFSRYGIASVLLGLLCVAAVAVLAVIWSGHHDEAAERTYQTSAMQAAADWTGVLINMNKDNVDGSLQKLHDGTVGQLNADFEAVDRALPRCGADAAVAAPRAGSKRWPSRTVHHDLDAAPGVAPPQSTELPPGMAARTDTVMVVATSVSQNAGGKPQTVRWNLRLGVSDVDGKLLISRLESMR